MLVVFATKHFYPLWLLCTLLLRGLRLILQQKRQKGGVALAGGVRRLLKSARLPRLHKA